MTIVLALMERQLHQVAAVRVKSAGRRLPGRSEVSQRPPSAGMVHGKAEQEQ